MSVHWIKLEQFNVNDETAVLIRWLASGGSTVNAHDEIAEVETAKAVYRVSAGHSGFLRPVVKEGDRLATGTILAAVTDTAEEILPEIPKAPAPALSAETAGTGKKWTLKAEILAQKHHVKIEEVEAFGVVQEADVLAHLQKIRQGAPGQKNGPSGAAVKGGKLAVLGAGRGAVLVLDALCRMKEWKATALYDDSPANHGKKLMNTPVLGHTDEALKHFKEKKFDAAVISISTDIRARGRMFLQLKNAGIPLANVIDPSAVIGEDASLGEGNVILGHCRVGPAAVVGNNNFLSAFVNIEHHNVLGDGCTFGPGVMTSSRVLIGSRVKFGTGIFVEPGVKIGDEAVVASGSILTQDVEAHASVKSTVRVSIKKISDGA